MYQSYMVLVATVIITLIAGYFDREKAEIPLWVFAMLFMVGMVRILMDGTYLILNLIDFSVVTAIYLLLEYVAGVRIGFEDMGYLLLLSVSAAEQVHLITFLPTVSFTMIITALMIFTIEKIRRGWVSLSSYAFMYYFSIAYVLTALTCLLSLPSPW